MCLLLSIRAMELRLRTIIENILGVKACVVNYEKKMVAWDSIFMYFLYGWLRKRQKGAKNGT